MRKRNFSRLGERVSVLVEKEASIRKSWQEFFKSRGMRLVVFDSAASFISNFLPDENEVEFFFDQDIGEDRGAGVRLANYVLTWPGRASVSLVTSYSPELFSKELEEGVIEAVLPKFPTEIFSEGYFENHIRRRITEEGFEAFLVDCFGRIHSELKQLEGAVANTTSKYRSKGEMA